jgi:hypothetical protein
MVPLRPVARARWGSITLLAIWEWFEVAGPEEPSPVVNQLLAVSYDRPARVNAMSAVSHVQGGPAQPQEGEQNNRNQPDNLDDGHHG